MTLRERQKLAIEALLRLDGTATAASGSTWKILVLDEQAQRIIGPVMRVSDLRQQGVTLYL